MRLRFTRPRLGGRWRRHMRKLRALVVIVPLALVLGAGTALAEVPGVELVGTGTVPGNGHDLSGLDGRLCNQLNTAACVPADILGGFGSDLAYTGHDDVYMAAPDRGPFDGLTDMPYVDRVNFLHIPTDVDAGTAETTLLDTRILRNKHNAAFVGAASAFDADNPDAGLRFDPEGLRVAPDGTFYVSDEYGPSILQFNRQGKLLRRIALPADFTIANPSATPNDELLLNDSGRQANRGMEGLAISPDGQTLYGMMQNALLQDEALIPGSTDRRSLFTRILKVDLNTGNTAEYAYRLDASNRGQGVSEILAI